MKKYLCSWPGCFNLVDEPRSYCDRHKAAAQAKQTNADAKPYRKPWDGAQRPNDPLYHTARWRALAKAVIAQHPACQICGATERLQVHHIEPPKGNEELFFDSANLMVVCFDCHQRLTLEERRVY